ncbi:putative integral membrane protein [Acanthocheilonema viteae]
MFTHSRFIIISFLILPLYCYERNTTNIIDKREKNHTIAKYVTTLLFSLFMLYGAFGNILMAIVLCNRDNSYSRSFILITLQLIICDLLTFLPVIVVLPIILQAKSNSDVHQTTWIIRTSSTLKPFTFLSLLHFTLLLTLNRFVALILPKYNAFFESAKLYFIIVFMWFSALVFSIVDFYFCTRSFSILKLDWTKNCTRQSSEIFLRLRYLWLSFLPIAMFVMYVAIFCSIRRKRRFTSDINQAQKISRTYTGQRTNDAKSSSYEQSMLIQAAVICGVMEIGIILHNLLPFANQIFDHDSYIPFAIFINCYSIFSRAVLPTTYFIYNKQARNTVKYLFLRLRLRIMVGRGAVVPEAKQICDIG